MQKQTWGEQFREAMNVNGGDLDNATTFAYVMHFLTFGWKVNHDQFMNLFRLNKW